MHMARWDSGARRQRARGAALAIAALLICATLLIEQRARAGAAPGDGSAARGGQDAPLQQAETPVVPTPTSVGEIGYREIRGRVENGNGQPIAGATVTCWIGGPGCPGPRTTGPDGLFSFGQVLLRDSQTVSIWAEASGYPKVTIYRNSYMAWINPIFNLTLNPPGNQLFNAGFEQDGDADGRPDGWSAPAATTLGCDMPHSGNCSIRHSSSGNVSYVARQETRSIAPGHTYTLRGWIKIPPTSDSFSYKLELVWRNTANSTLRTNVVKTYTTSTNGWVLARGSYVAPPNATNVVIRMNIASLNATIYSDDLFFSEVFTTAPWAFDVYYAAGAKVTYGGRLYQSLQDHRSYPGGEPPNTPSLWLDIGAATP